MEAPRTAALGDLEKPTLEFSYFHRREIGPHGHALALTPSRGRDQSRALSLQQVFPAFIGTVSPADSLSARPPFALGL